MFVASSPLPSPPLRLLATWRLRPEPFETAVTILCPIHHVDWIICSMIFDIFLLPCLIPTLITNAAPPEKEMPLDPLRVLDDDRFSFLALSAESHLLTREELQAKATMPSVSSQRRSPSDSRSL